MGYCSEPEITNIDNHCKSNCETWTIDLIVLLGCSTDGVGMGIDVDLDKSEL